MNYNAVLAVVFGAILSSNTCSLFADIFQVTIRGQALSGDGNTVVGYTSSGIAAKWTLAGGATQFFTTSDDTAYISRATAVSFDGTVVAGDRGFAAGQSTATTLSPSISDLLPRTIGNSLIDVSSDGSTFVGDVIINGTFHTFYLKNPLVGYVQIPDLPGGIEESVTRAISADGSTIVGSSSSANGPNKEAFRWTETGGTVGLGKLAPTDFSIANEVSANGSSIVGNSGNSAFLWTQSTGMTELAFSQSSLSQALAIADNGSIIGGTARLGNGADFAAVWIPGQTGVAFSDYLLSKGVDFTGWESFGSILDISADGRTFLGSGTFLGSPSSFLVQINAVPEPTSMLGLISLVTVTGVASNRARRKRSVD